MPYIDFGNSPVKKNDEPKQIHNCEGCCHKINISNNICRCSIHNTFMFNDTKFKTNCCYKETSPVNRKLIIGVFTYDIKGNAMWTGMITFAKVRENTTDEQLFNELHKGNVKNLEKQYAELSNLILIHCVLAESINDGKFINKTTLIHFNIMNDIINDANKP